MSVEVLLNVIVICLLVPTIIFAVILNKRLEVLRSSRADLGRLIEAFNDACGSRDSAFKTGGGQHGQPFKGTNSKSTDIA